MQQIQINPLNPSAPMACSKCGGLMRLVGSEPHPVQAGTDLLTFACTQCEAFDILPMPFAVVATASTRKNAGL